MTPDYYMTRPEELVKQPDAMPAFELIAAATSEPEDAADIFNALWSFWNFAHALDDLLDEGAWSEATKENALRVTFDFVGAALTRPRDGDEPKRMRALFEQLLDRSGWSEHRKGLALDALKDFAGNLLANPFYREHAREHKAMFDMMIARTIDADHLERTRPDLKHLLPAIRCADVDFIVHCAKLAGGWELMRQIGKLRDYDVEASADGKKPSPVWKI